MCGHITAGASYGGEHEAISLVGGLDAAARRLGWEAVVVGPGPGILGSATRLGHGGMAALDAAHAALALGLPTLLCPRLSSSDQRERHRGLSHHTASVLALLLAPVRVPVPEAELEGWPLLSDEQAPAGGSAGAALEELIALCTGRHDVAVEPVDLDGYAESGLPAKTMGRAIPEDPLFFAAPLAAGRALAAAVERVREAASGANRIGRRVYEGRVVDVEVDEYRYDDGEIAEREIVVHPGAVAIVAHDERSRLHGAPAARGRRRGRRCSSCRPGSSTWRVRRRSSAPSASSSEEIGEARRASGAS